MRDIIFRGKRLDGKGWVESMTIAYGDIRHKKGIELLDIIKNEWVEVDPATVGQYTGLQDKNGKKIFEGDILAFVGVENPKAFFVIVEWDARSCCYYLKRMDVNICNRYGFFPSSYTLEGNIHDNPDLLK